MELCKHYKLNSALRYITVILLIVSTANAGLKAVTDDEDSKYFDIEDNELVLKCEGATTLSWTKNKTDVKNAVKNDSHGSRFTLTNNSLIIKRLQVEDAGTYKCTDINDSSNSAEINVVANTFPKKMPENLSVVEGEKLRLTCKVFGTDPQITWTVAYDVGSEEKWEDVNETRISYEKVDNVDHSVLVINEAILTDRGKYKCTITNKATEFNPDKYKKSDTATFVRVKGKLAALWPFLGICVEVLVLCGIILIYEKRRNKEGLDESDTDQSPEQEKLKTGK